MRCLIAFEKYILKLYISKFGSDIFKLPIFKLYFYIFKPYFLSLTFFFYFIF